MTMSDETEFSGMPVQVDEDGKVPELDGEAAANQYLRDLHRQRKEHAQIIGRYDIEIERLKAERDDLAKAPAVKADLLEGALAVWHQKQIAAAKAAGVPDKKLPLSIDLAVGRLRSSAGRVSTKAPAEDAEEYIDFFAWVESNCPTAIDDVPASRRVNLANLKKLLFIEEDTEVAYLGEPTVDEDGEKTGNEVPHLRYPRGERTFTAD